MVVPSTALLPGWLEAIGKLPGFKRETASKGDGIIAGPATELDPTIKAGTPTVTPSGSSVIDDIFKTPLAVNVAEGLVDYVTTMLGENGPQVASKTIWKGDDKERIDFENPNPGQRPEKIHYQEWMRYAQAEDFFSLHGRIVTKLRTEAAAVGAVSGMHNKGS